METSNDQCKCDECDTTKVKALASSLGVTILILMCTLPWACKYWKEKNNNSTTKSGSSQNILPNEAVEDQNHVSVAFKYKIGGQRVQENYIYIKVSIFIGVVNFKWLS